jgi:hypothetical protein
MKTEDANSGKMPPGSADPPVRQALAPEVFRVPRRYDLATLLAVTMAYACLFGVLRIVMEPGAVIWIAGFLTTVGISQAILFGGRCPRAASVLAGMGFMAATIAFVVMIEFQQVVQTDERLLLLSIVFKFVLLGAMLGYFGGVLVAGVFLIAHHLRRLWPTHRKLDQTLPESHSRSN